MAHWKETAERSIELADVSFTLLSTLLDYCKSNNIPLYREQGLWNLVNKAQSIIKEIENLTSIDIPKLSDELKHVRKSDDKVPEPHFSVNTSKGIKSSDSTASFCEVLNFPSCEAYGVEEVVRGLPIS